MGRGSHSMGRGYILGMVRDTVPLVTPSAMIVPLLLLQLSDNRAGYKANKQSLTGGQGQFADGQGHSFGGQGLYFGSAGAVMLRNHKVGQFRVIQNFL